MIKYNPKTWFRHIVSVNHSDTINKLWKELLALGLFTLGIAYLEIKYIGNTESLKDLMQVYSLVGFVLSLLLVFRTNTAYDRWWEGRKKWGELVNNSRNLAIKITSISDNADIKKYFSRMISNNAFALKEHLREGVNVEELDLTGDEIKEIETCEHKTSYLSMCMYKKLDQMKREGLLSEETYITIDVNLKSFSDITGSCERIKNTPIPYSYSMFFKKFIFIYVTTLPLAFVYSFGYYSSLVSIFVFYVLVSMEILAEEIEDPFGKDDNDLPTDALSQKIKENVQEILR
ncbi:MAG: bestrophin family ion channel [Crocinitomicaceae bacterium]|nr:bestrophin family ion channel [Crocinitomicaceae bacterium]